MFTDVAPDDFFLFLNSNYHFAAQLFIRFLINIEFVTYIISSDHHLYNSDLRCTFQFYCLYIFKKIKNEIKLAKTVHLLLT